MWILGEKKGDYWHIVTPQHVALRAALKDDYTLHGPVFIQEPSNIMFPLDSEEKKVKLSCEVKGNPKPHIRWKLNGTDVDIGMDFRYSVVEGSLLINNPNKTQDSGTYQCIATNSFGTIVSREAKLRFAYLENFKTRTRSTVSVRRGQGMVLLCGPPPHSGDPTKVMVPPSSMDVTVGESIVLPCQVTHDHSLDIVFTWSFNGHLIDFDKDGDHFERVGGQDSAGDLMIRNIQLKHAGKYVCMVQTSVDKLTAAADLIVRGPPGPPEAVTIDEITDTTAQLSWRPGPDNHSPITMYVIQARTPFSVGWQAVSTVPELVDGKTFTATVVGLNPWVEYEFRTVAANVIGIGEPSRPSEKRRTEEAQKTGDERG